MSELDWGIGFYEGEGTACVVRGTNPHPRAQVTIVQVDRWPIDRFRLAIGFQGSLVLTPANPPKRAAWRLCYQKKAEVRAILTMLMPGLSPRRQVQAQATLDSLALRPGLHGARTLANGKLRLVEYTG
jgi:hypothetical protein